MKARKHLTIRSLHVRIPLWWPDLLGNWHTWLPNRGNVLFTLLVVAGLLYAGRAGALPLGEPAAPALFPSQINYQGYVQDLNGVPLDGEYDMVFSLYNDPDGTNLLWQEEWITPTNQISVTNGLFNVALGRLNPINDTALNEDSLYLGISIDGDPEALPREQLTMVPYAWSANTVSDGAVTTAKLADNAVTSAKIQDGQVGNADLANNAVNSAKIQDGQVTTADLADNAVSSAKIQDGQVGNADLADNAVNSVKIQDGQVTTADLANSAVTSDKIAGGAVTQAHAPSLVRTEQTSNALVRWGWGAFRGNNQGVQVEWIGVGPFANRPVIIVQPTGYKDRNSEPPTHIGDCGPGADVTARVINHQFDGTQVEFRKSGRFEDYIWWCYSWIAIEAR